MSVIHHNINDLKWHQISS